MCNETIIGLFNDLEKISQDLKSRRACMNSELSKVDKEITDIEHYIEFCQLSACQGYKAAKMMKDCLIRRRAVKDEMETINRILIMNVGFIGNGKGRKILSKVQNKQYTPRILKELFENAPASTGNTNKSE